MYKLLLLLHIGGGALALIAMVVPLLSRKGGTLHRRAGWVYVVGMAIVCATAFALSGIRFLSDDSDAGREFAILLSYLSVVTGAGMWAGLRVLRAKHRDRRGHPVDIAMAGLLASSGLGVGLYGLQTGSPLILAFSLVGLLNGSGQLQYWLRPAVVPMHWWFAHMGNMVGACIATVTALALFVARRTGYGDDSLVLWLAPTVAGLPLMALWMAYYWRRFSSARRQAWGSGVI